eukprot:GHVR01051178.1.p1 GENE.GHVR01051178.1~~GHVR01051178.1.p1  ORF type:complete len:129 (+),score=21.82 GHVR01051178.1:14-400(+)
MFLSTQGYSGTMQNTYIFPHTINKDNIILESGGNGKVKMLNSKDTQIKPIVKKYVKSVVSLFDITNLVALIDIGAVFKTYKNQKFAEEMMSHLGEKIDGVLYFDEVSNSLRLLRNNQSPKEVLGQKTY